MELLLAVLLSIAIGLLVLNAVNAKRRLRRANEAAEWWHQHLLKGNYALEARLAEFLRGTHKGCTTCDYGPFGCGVCRGFVSGSGICRHCGITVYGRDA